MNITRMLKVSCLRYVDTAIVLLVVVVIMVPVLLLADFTLKSINTDPWFLNNYHIAMKCGDFSLPFRYPDLYLRSIGEILLALITVTCLSLLSLFMAPLRSCAVELKWEVLGSSQFFSTSFMRMVQRDACGELHELRIDDYKMVMVRVRNSTVELDGSTQEFVLRVPPHVKTAREAVAWTFQLAPHDYCPESES